MQYLVAQKQTVQELIELVNHLMLEGYMPVGGVTFDKLNHCTQAMILLEEPKSRKRRVVND